jgi:hypothetical protein
VQTTREKCKRAVALGATVEEFGAMILNRFAASMPEGGMARGRRLGAMTLLLLTFAVEPGAAQNIIAYPARGQSQQQQERDRFDCYNWAVQQTGFNPQMQQSGSTAPPPPVGGGALPGAAKGAALGAVGGAIGGDAGKGAAIGAGVGGAFGGMRRREAEAQQYQAQSQQAAANSQRSAGFNRAMGACLQGRGYTVS